MRINRIFCAFFALLVLGLGSGCDKIDNKTVPSFTVRIDLGSIALWNTYGVTGMGEYRIFSREKQLPSNFPYNVNTYTGYGGVLLMMGIEAPMAYDLSCPVEVSRDVILTINPENYELTGAGGPLSGVAINNKVGMRQYRVLPSNGGYVITN